MKVRLNYVSPAALSMPDDVKMKVAANGIKQVGGMVLNLTFNFLSMIHCFVGRLFSISLQHETDDLTSVMADTDILYVLRIQKERFESEDEYAKYAGCYIIDLKALEPAKTSLRVMHPLPRVGQSAF